MSDYRETAEQAIAAIEAAGERLAAACRQEMWLEDQRALVKALAIRRLMTTTNPDTEKPHSATSAEKVVETDAEYAAHRARQADAVVETIKARAAYEAAKRRADVAIDLGMLLSSAGGPG